MDGRVGKLAWAAERWQLGGELFATRVEIHPQKMNNFSNFSKWLFGLTFFSFLLYNLTETDAQTLQQNRNRLLGGLLRFGSSGLQSSRIATPAPTVRPFGGYVLYKMQGIVCPGFGPWIIRPSNLAPAGPYYLFDPSLSDLQNKLDSTMKKLKETRDVIDHIVADGGTPNQLTQDDEKAQVEDMKNYRNQIESAQSSFSRIQPYRWILGNYNIISAPCVTNTVPPAPVPAFSISLYGVSPGAQVIGR